MLKCPSIARYIVSCISFMMMMIVSICITKSEYVPATVQQRDQVFTFTIISFSSSIAIHTVISESKAADFEFDVVQKNCAFNNDVD